MTVAFAYTISTVFIFILSLLLFLNIFGLPANWIILLAAILWDVFYPATDGISAIYWIFLVGLAILGEIIETFLQLSKAKKYGSSKSGTIGGMLGAIIGSILCAPFFFGLGAFAGALGGAWFGCFIFELLKGRDFDAAKHAAVGTMVGRFLGTVCKCGIGGFMISIITSHVWPGDPTTVISQEERYVFFYALQDFR